MKNLSYLHPLLFAVFPLLAFYTSNIGKMKFTRIVDPLLISISLTIGLWLILNTVIKNRYKTGFLITYFLFLFYSYGHAHSALEESLLKNIDGEFNIEFFALWVILLATGGFFIIKVRKNLLRITKIINIIGILLITLSFFQIFYSSLKLNRVSSSNLSTEETGTPVDTKSPDKPEDQTGSPDIYYIILDGYAGNEVLSTIYGYDNKEFSNFLESKNFNIASGARSNYALTYLSILSSLNMKYINYLTDVAGEDSKNQILASGMIKNNEVLKFLKKQGYQTVHFSSGWGATNRNRFADQTVYCSDFDQFSSVLLMTTMVRAFGKYFPLQTQRERILCMFPRLAEIQEGIKKPIFVFAHIVSPHPPYVFDADGAAIADPKLNRASNVEAFENKGAYLNQLKFINKKMRELIEKLTEDKSNLPVIIIQADHGSASTPGMKEYNPGLIQERMRPFVAYMLPDKKNFIPDSVTPVNIFRLIFNNYFNAEYEILKDYVYFSTYEKPYKFIDVTENVSRPFQITGTDTD